MIQDKQEVHKPLRARSSGRIDIISNQIYICLYPPLQLLENELETSHWQTSIKPETDPKNWKEWKENGKQRSN